MKAAESADAASGPPETVHVEGVRGRTSELELLISGAVLFALIQLGRFADEAFLRLFLNLGGTLPRAAVIGYEYTKPILYTLIVTFVAHLAVPAPAGRRGAADPRRRPPAPPPRPALLAVGEAPATG